MKPENWKEMTEEQREKEAMELLDSVRGNIILSQALVKGIEKMREVPENRQETSNIEDMEMLLEEVYPYCMEEEEHETAV